MVRKKAARSRFLHKWIGILFCFFILVFCISGILLNHRQALSSYDISRGLLPQSYRYKNWNNAALRGALKEAPNRVLLYGGAGIWCTDSLGSQTPTDWMQGMKSGADRRQTLRILQKEDGRLFAVCNYDFYTRTNADDSWQCLTSLLPEKERLTDICMQGDTLIVMSRSKLFYARPPYQTFQTLQLKAPAGYRDEASLFRTIWLLHSGELFGLPGRLVVDLVALVLIVLCVTGIAFTLLPYRIRRRRKKNLACRKDQKRLQFSIRWHNKLGVWMLFFLLLISITGWFLRPPMLITIIRIKMKTLPGTSLHSPNPWHDKLRVLVYDKSNNSYLLYSSKGFYRLENLLATPKKCPKAPPVSVMGVNVLKPDGDAWLVGSFSGLYRWNEQGDASTAEDVVEHKEVPLPYRSHGRPVFSHLVVGYVDELGDTPFLISYGKGAEAMGGEAPFVEMPSSLNPGRMSLWHAALEFHVGRVYQFIWGSGLFAQLFVFFAGLLMLVLILTGYFVYRRRYRRRSSKG